VHWVTVLGNLAYAIVGGCLTVAFMVMGYKILDHITPFNTSEELQKGNRAVGMMVHGILTGIGVAIGLVIGLGLN